MIHKVPNIFRNFAFKYVHVHTAFS